MAFVLAITLYAIVGIRVEAGVNLSSVIEGIFGFLTAKNPHPLKELVNFLGC